MKNTVWISLGVEIYPNFWSNTTCEWVRIVSIPSYVSGMIIVDFLPHKTLFSLMGFPDTVSLPFPSVPRLSAAGTLWLISASCVFFSPCKFQYWENSLTFQMFWSKAVDSYYIQNVSYVSGNMKVGSIFIFYLVCF